MRKYEVAGSPILLVTTTAAEDHQRRERANQERPGRGLGDHDQLQAAVVEVGGLGATGSQPGEGIGKAKVGDVRRAEEVRPKVSTGDQGVFAHADGILG
jgi:hypothetical protein